ncbi:RxLR effector protein [Phytophthora megakarya]|uniref:RxLR effector protein n=1 Tax=Phytophthora megakarya TaxID=4795 RepID=A0A225WBL5_9STRA|nr:RxLR effector protein [Phytophthora megakarya]
MRLSYFLAAAITTMSVHQDPVTASVGSEVAFTGIMSLGFLHLVDADQSVSDQPRFLRGNNVAESDKEERMFALGVIEKLANQAKNKKELLKLKPAQLDKLLAEADAFMVSRFKTLDYLNMTPRDMEAQLRTVSGVSDDAIKEAVDAHAKYLNAISK